METLILGTVGILAKVFMRVFSRTKVVNGEVLVKHICRRHPAQPVVTIMNHRSIIDDPLIWAALPLRTFSVLDGGRMRWTLGAKELTFKNEFLAWVFTRGRILPIVRGRGIFQRGVDVAIEKMNSQGAWIHIFPEAHVGQRHEMRPFRWGAARLILGSKVFPTVIPVYHLGKRGDLQRAPPISV